MGSPNHQRQAGSQRRAAGTRQRLGMVPAGPGVYLHRNAAGEIIYIGKALNLRSRISSYFNSTAAMDAKTRDMARQIHDFEYVLTDTEQEALLLENTLIKRHQPPCNVRLKDGKSYPYIKVDMAEDFPRVYITRRMDDPGGKALYFGPYASAGSVNRTMRLIKKLYPYRSCTKTITGNDRRPCLEYYIKRCVAPCSGHATRQQYRQVIKDLVDFLERGPAKSLPRLRKEMAAASAAQDYERAALLRDRIRDFEAIADEQKVAGIGSRDVDAIAAVVEGDRAWVEIFFVRNGSIMGREQFIMDGTSGTSQGQVLAAFIGQFYNARREVAPAIICSEAPQDAPPLEQWLSARSGRAVRISAPQRGIKRQLIMMVRRNAEHARDKARLKQAFRERDSGRALADLQEALNLPEPPKRIECFDISHLQGTAVVASMAVFHDGAPDSHHYRRFKIKVKRANDDFASMAEVLERRLKYLKAGDAKDASFGRRPDLILIDGGLGQLGAAVGVALNAGQAQLQLAAIAKREELIYRPNHPEPLYLPRDSQALFLLQNVRDEAHRFAVTYHRQQRGKAAVASGLDAVPGVGPKRKRELIRRFGSAAAVKAASVDQLRAVPGVSERLARQLREAL